MKMLEKLCCVTLAMERIFQPHLELLASQVDHENCVHMLGPTLHLREPGARSKHVIDGQKDLLPVPNVVWESRKRKVKENGVPWEPASLHLLVAVNKDMHGHACVLMWEVVSWHAQASVDGSDRPEASQ